MKLVEGFAVVCVSEVKKKFNYVHGDREFESDEF